jgi:hypothetical protein
MAETKQQRQDTFFGVPMSWEWNVPKMLRNYWNSDDQRIFPPKVFGIGWDMNGHALLRRLGVIPPPKKES